MRRRLQDGYVALLAVLMVGAIALSVATALLLTGTDSQRTALVVQQARQARSLAIACGQEAAQAVHDNIAYHNSGSLSQGQGSCTYSVTLTSATTRTITATGTVGSVVQKVTATATVGASTMTLSGWKEVTTNGAATPAFVQLAYSTPQTAQTSVAVTFTNTEAAGDTNIVVIGSDSLASTISSVTDTAGNTYVAAAPLTRGTSNSQAIYYAKNVAAAKPTITVTFSASSTFPDIRIMEYSGLDTVAPFDTSVSGIGTNNPGNSGTLNTNYPTDLIVAAGTVQNTFSAAGAGYTLRVITSPDSDIVEDQVVTSTGAYSATATASGNWVMQAAAFRAAGQ